MSEVAFPLKPRMRRSEVGDLQVALKELLDKGALVARNEETRRELSAALEIERTKHFFGSATRRLVSMLQEEQGLPVSGEVDEATARVVNRMLSDRSGEPEPPSPPGIYEVRGVVRFEIGVPAIGTTVQAFDRDLRTEQLLGQTETDRSGAYRIAYSERDFRELERGSADLLVKVLARDSSLLATSAVLFNAPPRAEIDLTIPLGSSSPSVFELVASTVAPLLAGLMIDQLDESEEHQDLTFLAGETRFEKRILARFVLAHQLSRIGIEPEFWFSLLGRFSFGYTENLSLAENLARISAALPSLDGAAVAKAIDASFAQREINESLREKAPSWIEEFVRIMARASLDDARSPSFVRLALEHAGIKDAKKQEKFALLFNQFKSLTSDLLASLDKDRSFKKAEIADLSASYRLAELTRSDFSVVGMLKDSFDIRRPDQIWSLAKLSQSQWTDLIAAKLKDGSINLPLEFGDAAVPLQPPQAEVYGRTLERQFREAFPTGAFTGGIERALQNGGARGMQHGEALARFLNRHPAFELQCTPIEEFLKSRVHPDFTGLAKNESFRRELKAVQRIFKLAPTFEATDALLADGLHSAQLVYRIGESEFARRYINLTNFSAGDARLVWNRAADTHSAVLTLVGDLQALRGEQLPIVLQNNNTSLTTFPNWDSLFQAGDLCSCNECRSVLGPAAYFADILMFLRDRKAANPAFTLKDILFRRRADLGYLELNCENANTVLPYIDLVCEVLESVVSSGANDVELLGLGVMPAGSAAAKAAVTAALTAAGINPDADYSLSQVDPAYPDRWVIHGDDTTYLLKKKATPNFFVQVLPNTKADSDELRAYPAYVDSKAYDKLRQARFPLGLPFDLFAEEVRAAFQQCNLQRWDLMRTLHGTAAPNNPTDGAIAAEYFGISSDAAAAFDEKRLILVADATPAGQQAVWGESGNAGWLNTIANVKIFLDKSGLEYEELLALLDLRFVNAAGDILIQHLDSSCDTDKKVIQGLTAEKLDRIHRFLRMWHKLRGWAMWELDLVIRCAGIGGGALDEPFLINLYYFGRVKTRLGTKATVEQLCGLFDHLIVDTQFTALYEKRTDGLYQRLFLNKKLIRPLDPAFEVAAVDVPGPTAEKISGHRPGVLAALGVRETDLDLLAALTRASNSALYISDDLTLTNLSFLWRHAWLSKILKLKLDEWKTLLTLMHQDVALFADPKAALDFVEAVDLLTATGFTADELDWLLTADRSAKAAIKEADATRFLAALRIDLQAIHREYDPSQYDYLDPPADVDRLVALLTTLLQQLHRDEPAAQFFVDSLRDEVQMQQTVAGLPAGFDFPAAIKNAVMIRYDEPATRLRFTGLMTPAQRTTLLTDGSLAAVTGIAAYQEAVEEFFERPRLALKFFDPVFTAPLQNLPPAVDFAALTDPTLAARVSYDPEERELQVVGTLIAIERDALDKLSADPAYRNAVNSIFTQPVLGAFPPDKIWLQDADLQFPLRDLIAPANDNLNHNLATALKKALTYLAKASSESLVVQRAGGQLGLTDGLTRRLTQYNLLPEPLLTHLTSTFAASVGVVDYATLKPTFDGWFWANRVAAIWKKWKLTIAERDQINDLTATAQLMDFAALRLDDTGAITSLDRFIRTSRLVRFKQSLPETEITVLEVLEKLSGGAYGAIADFADDVERLNDAWSDTDVAAFVASLDLAYPNDYLLVENWERLRRGFYFVDSLNAGATSVIAFAAAAMTAVHAKTLKELLRSGLGLDTWLPLSTEIQDALRERKRDALAAYLLTQPKPADAPTGKWDNTNDLYAYYLLDVEMSACQLTSRLVQGSGSVQLFVQRCLMGLEPDAKVQADGADGDSAWHWWKWMRKYRVWQANREVFLWPENWIEPELKRDRSPFLKEMETELLQNDINQYTVETAFRNYLEKLNDVAQVELAGFYQEDDGDDTVIHVFGRTRGTEPHTYYYRRYDYRQWTPWEKVDLDIKDDYLIPAVVANRLFLFWPVFMEVPDDAGNNTVPTPNVDQAGVPVQKASKKLKLQIAVSDYRQGKWTPKRVSKQYDESSAYNVEIVRKHYAFFPIDQSTIDGRFGIAYRGSSTDRNGAEQAFMSGSFAISGCYGVPEIGGLTGWFTQVVRPATDSTGGYTTFLKWKELDYRSDSPEDDFTLESSFVASNALALTPLLTRTPGIFEMTPSWQLSYLDRFWLGIPAILLYRLTRLRELLPSGTWLPFFYNDQKRTFFVLPELQSECEDRIAAIPNTDGGGHRYYPEIKREFRAARDSFEGQIRGWVASLDLLALSPAQRQQLEATLQRQVPIEEQVPPFTDSQLREHIVRFFMRFADYYLGMQSLRLFQFRRFEFRTFYHPFVCDFSKLVENPLQGINGLMKRETQLQDSGFSFLSSYGPRSWVADPWTQQFYPREIVDFAPDGAYSSYNWELFFHAPLFIANALSKNQRFEEARDWYHFIFNPIGVESAAPGGSAMSKYWITKPFFETTDPQYIQQRIENILLMLAGDTSVPGYSPQAKQALEDQVRDWRTYPFEPHRIANYRTVAYQKTIVMKYLDNLITWGDYLFGQDSMESINEATQLYILAAELLGRRPKKMPPQAKPPLESFNELETQLDAFSNALIEVENLVPPQSGTGQSGSGTAPLPTLYFCIPHNDKMLSYWDTVADRLYKIRHCMNIEGVVRQLALFEPPIDPGALVKAVAAGVDIGTALADLNAPLPLQRFTVLLQKANDICNDVKSLGSVLLSALEKKDAEALSLLRQSQEISVLDAVTDVRQKQIDEANENLESAKRSKELAEIKEKYYESRDFMNPGEIVALSLSSASTAIDAGIALAYVLSGGLKAVPQFLVGASGFGGSPHATAETGGLAFGSIAEDAALTLTSISHALEKGASIATTVASYQRRKDDWDLQKDMASKEIEQVDKSIAAAELRVSIAEKELDNHLAQIDNAKAIDAFMHSKYTNDELYQWQVGQISGVYFQSYKLACDLAKRAERCYRFELGLQESSIISFGYWDSLKKGLLSGEKLQYDLRRLEASYLEQNRREFELTKHVSLALLDPLALVKLRETGRCFFQLPEELFDLDYPGHYFRRIKSVSLTLPCVTGPYTTIPCTLRLLKSSVRINTSSGDNGYPRNTDDNGLPTDDLRFVETNIPVKAIAASSGQNDSGVFELSFRDERYLPFEGAGAVSEWALELFNDLPSNNPDPVNPDFGQPLRQFDYGSVSDAVLHLKYTAREDAGALKNGAITHLREHLSQADGTPSALMLNLRRDFPAEWSRFLNPTIPANGNVFALKMSPDLFSLRDADKTLKINTISVLARCTDPGNYRVTLTPPLPAPPPVGANTLTLTKSNLYGGLHFSEKDVTGDAVEMIPTLPPEMWQFKVTRPGGGSLAKDPLTGLSEVEDAIVILGYQWA